MSEPTTLYDRHLSAVREWGRQRAAGMFDSNRATDYAWWQEREASIGARLSTTLGLHRSEAHPRVRTTHIAAVLAATALWLDACDVRAGEDPPVWTWDFKPEILLETDRDLRMMASLTLRRAGQETEPQMIARWLAAHGEISYSTAGHLARHIGLNKRRINQLGAAWWHIFGTAVLESVAPNPDDDPAGPGRPSREQSEQRTMMQVAAQGVASTGAMTKGALAARLGISRPTLDAWL